MGRWQFKAGNASVSKGAASQDGEQEGTKTELCYRLLLSKRNSRKRLSCSGILDFIPLYAMWRVYVLRKRYRMAGVRSSSHVAPREISYFWRQQGEWVEEPTAGEAVKVACTRDKPQWTFALSKRRPAYYRSWLHPAASTVLRETRRHQRPALVDVRVPEMVFCEARRDPTPLAGTAGDAALDGFNELKTGTPRLPRAIRRARCMNACSRIGRQPWRACTRGWQHASVHQAYFCASDRRR